MASFECDPRKSESNLERHGIDFEEAQKLWAGDYAVLPAKRTAGEERQMLVGAIGDRIYAAIFTMRARYMRIISCHRADARLERIYEEHVAQNRPH